MQINQIKKYLREAPLKREILRRQSQDPRPPSPWFYARDVDECPVKVWLRRTGRLPALADIPSKPGRIAIWERGWALEKEVTDALKFFLPTADSRVPTLRKTYNPGTATQFTVAGRPDLLYADVVFEIKSTSDEHYKDMRRLDDCYQSWKDQLYLYQDMFAASEGYLIVVSRDYPKYRVFRVEFDSDRFNYIKYHFSNLERMIQSGEMPSSENCYADCPCKTVEVGGEDEEDAETEASQSDHSDPPHNLPDPR